MLLCCPCKGPATVGLPLAGHGRLIETRSLLLAVHAAAVSTIALVARNTPAHVLQLQRFCTRFKAPHSTAHHTAQHPNSCCIEILVELACDFLCL